jgi:hypothetical protein
MRGILLLLVPLVISGGACSSPTPAVANGGGTDAAVGATGTDPGASRAGTPVSDDGGTTPAVSDARACVLCPPPDAAPTEAAAGADAPNGTADAYQPDIASADATPGESCTLDEELTFGNQGGFIAYHDEDTITVAGILGIRRVSRGGQLADAPAECHDRLPCHPALTDLRAALGDPDVVTALAQPQPPRYGTPIADVGTFVFRTAAGRGFDLFPAGAAPAGIKKLVQLLGQFQTSVLASPACANLRP